MTQEEFIEKIQQTKRWKEFTKWLKAIVLERRWGGTEIALMFNDLPFESQLGWYLAFLDSISIEVYTTPMYEQAEDSLDRTLKWWRGTVDNAEWPLPDDNVEDSPNRFEAARESILKAFDL